MSMLAERRRKQKWSLNPRGKDWSLDSNKFGQKLLEKMGWSAGKGLGAKEDGITEHIKVSYKNDSKGMGYKESDSQWTEHESNFSELLSSLTGPNINTVVDKENDIKPESLEKKSQKSRARVHYHKFTRGKDLSRYSEKDLANIFGRKHLKTVPKNDTETTEPNTDSSDKSYGVETLNGGNMLDYFKKKMPNYRKYNVNGINSESEDERPAFGFGFKADKRQNSSEPTFVSYINPNENGAEENMDTSNTVIEAKGVLQLAFTPLKKKSKKFESLDSLDDNEVIQCTPKKKKNKSKDKKDTLTFEMGLTNKAFDPMFPTIVKIEKRLLDAIEEEEEQVIRIIEPDEETEPLEKKKSKKERKKRDAQLTLDNDNASENITEEAVNKTSKKLKKNKKKGIFNVSFENCEPEIIPVESSPNLKRKRSTFSEGIENTCFEDFYDDALENDKESKKLKKNASFDIIETIESPKTPSKKKKVTFSEIDHICYSDSEDGDTVMDSDTIPNEEKTRKRKNVEGIENVCFEDFAEEQNIGIDENLEPSCKKRKKSKKDKKHDAGVENCAFDEDFNATPVVQESTEAFEVKRKSKKRKMEEAGINNPGFEDNYSKHKEKKIKTSVEGPNVAIPEEFGELLLNVSMASVTDKDKESKDEQSPNKYSKKGKKGNRNGRNEQSLSKQLDDCQAAVENDINQAREFFIGEPTVSDGEDSILPDGNVKLKLKNAKFGQLPKWMHKNKGLKNPKSSYRHLIKGDIILGFSNTNLHEIKGYDPTIQHRPQTR